MKLSVATIFKPDFLDAIEGYPVAELFGKLPSDSIGGEAVPRSCCPSLP